MDLWTEYAEFQVTERAKADKHYQALLEQCLIAEKSYLRIVEKLSEQDRADVEHYLTICEEMQYRMAQLAYQFGRESI